MNGVLHPACGKRFPSGDRTGHCSQCHATFYGVTAFDRHQRSQNGRVRCLTPTTNSGEWRLDAENRWHHGAQMTVETAAMLLGDC